MVERIKKSALDKWIIKHELEQMAREDQMNNLFKQYQERISQKTLFDTPIHTPQSQTVENEEGNTQMETQKNEAPRMKVNLDGKQEQKKREFVEVDSYIGTIVGISDIFEAPKFQSDTEKVPKLIINVEIDDNKIILPYFMTANVTRNVNNKGGMKDSTLYTVLDKAGYIPMFSKKWEEISGKEDVNKLFVDWLKENLMGEKIKFIPKTVAPAEGDKYSVVSEILKFFVQGAGKVEEDFID